MNARKKLLIYGGSGLLGSELVKQLSKNYLLINPARSELDLEKRTKVIKHLRMTKPDYIIYSAGIVKAEEAEKDPEAAYRLNAYIPGYIAKEAVKLRIPVFYISTNAVFDGLNKKTKISEKESTKSVSVYGKSKSLGEKAVLSASNKNTVIRAMMLYSHKFDKKTDFARRILESLKKNKKTPGIENELITPLYISTAVKAVKAIIGRNKGGIYHLASVNRISNYEFARLLAKKFKFNPKLIFPILLKDFHSKKNIYKPLYPCLNVDKFEKEFGKNILQTVEKDLADFKRNYSH